MNVIIHDVPDDYDVFDFDDIDIISIGQSYLKICDYAKLDRMR